MAEDDRSVLDVNKVQDINANGLPNPLSSLCIPTVSKQESKEQLGQETDSIHLQRWTGRESLSSYTLEMEDKTRHHQQQQHCSSFSLPDSRDSMLNPVPISTPNHFLSGINHSITNQHPYMYRGDQLFNHNVTRNAQLGDLKPQMCGSPLEQQQSAEDPHCNSVSSSNPSFSISQGHEEKALLQDSNLTEESAADTSAASPPASVECIVCGDKSSGKHYGQYTCEGCKSFFKRSVRRNLNYTCRGSRNCPVDLQHRNQCQYCRFQKCVKLGMRREAVQKGRVPQNNMLVYQQHIGCSLTPWPPQDPSHHSIHGVAIIPSYNHAPLISSLIKADDIFPLRFPVPRVNNLVDQSSHLLIGIIEWAKRLPSFSDLDIHDQVALLKNCWPDLFLISAMQVSMPLPVSQMVSTCLSPETDRVTVMSQLVDHSHILQNQLERLKSLSLDAAEFASLKAILLFNPDTIGIASNSQVETMQEKIHSALEEYMRLHYPNQISRFGKMLLRLPTLSKASSQIIEQLILMRLVNRDSVDSLIQNFLLRSINLSTNAAHSLPNGLSSFSNVGSAASSLPSASPHSTPATILPSNNLATAVLTPQLPSPCLPHSNAPSTPICTVSHQNLHTSTPIANHWLNTSPSCIDSSAMRLQLPGNTDVNLNTLITQPHQNM